MSSTTETGLDQEETTVTRHFPMSYRDWKTHTNTAELIATIEAFEYRTDHRSKTHLDNLLNCSTYAYFVRHTDTGEVRIHSSKCRQRWCSICGQTLANWRTMALLDWVGDLNRPKFLTLTLKHSNAPLQQQIANLYDSFKKLRKVKLLRQTIRGGIWFFQVKQSTADTLWHPHLHIVADSSYIPKNQLSRAWLQITKTSKIVDIKVITNPATTAKYVARYSSRPAALADLPIPKRLELMDSLAGKRLCGSWGTARQVALKPPRSTDSDKWVSVGEWSLVTRSLKTSSVARSIVRAWITSTPIPEGCTLSECESELDSLVFSDEPETYAHSTIHSRSPPCIQLTFRDLLEHFEMPSFALAY